MLAMNRAVIRVLIGGGGDNDSPVLMTAVITGTNDSEYVLHTQRVINVTTIALQT